MPKSSYHTDEFSKRATSYKKHNIIQKKVVKKLIENIDSKPKNILDLGCGDGGVFKLLTWKIESFTGVDKAINMCKLHPTNKNIELFNQDFEKFDFKKYDLVISSSALQWTKDLDSLLQKISYSTKEIAFSIFCDGTFKTIYEVANLKPFLPNKDELLELLDKYFVFEKEIVNYKLDFEDNLSKFRYIKNSGVSGGERKLSFKDTKKLIENYPHGYLEFEVIFIWGKTKRS